MYPPPPAHQPRHNPAILVLAGVGGLSIVGLAVVGAFFLGRDQSRKEPPAPLSSATGALQPASGAQPAPPLAPALPPPPVPAAPSAPADERVMTATHGRAYAQPLMFHYAHVGGRGIADVHGQLDHRDGHYFQLGPGDSLTLEAPDGQEFLSDGTDGVFDLELEVHPHDHESHRYEIDVSHAHLDVNGPWVVLGHGEAHEWDLDHVRLRAARYVRIRNLDGAAPLYVDGVYVRRMQPCTDVARCRDVNHLAAPR